VGARVHIVQGGTGRVLLNRTLDEAATQYSLILDQSEYEEEAAADAFYQTYLMQSDAPTREPDAAPGASSAASSSHFALYLASGCLGKWVFAKRC
jgi:hypothetical protein